MLVRKAHLPRRDDFMALLGAEMRHIDQGRRIVCVNGENGAGRRGFQAFADFQDGQGAQEPPRVERVIGFHTQWLALHVTKVQRYCDASWRDAVAFTS